MPSSEDRFYGENFSFADMAEAPRRARESKIKSVAAIAGSTIVVLVLAIMLFVGSLPAMTPEEIVQRNDYEGQQPPRHIFNLYSLKQDRLRHETDPKFQDQLVTKEAVEDVAELSIDVADTASATIDSAVPLTVEKSDTQVIQKIPTAAVRAYEKSELSRNITPTVVSAVIDESSSSSTEQEQDNVASGVTVLPVYTINANQTNLRSQPNLDAPVLKLLNKGQALTVFNRTSNWVQVATNDGSGTTGYVHKSLLEMADIDQ